jgi:hypothetical protein
VSCKSWEGRRRTASTIEITAPSGGIDAAGTLITLTALSLVFPASTSTVSRPGARFFATDVILVDFRLCVARGAGHNRVADVRSRIERAHDVQAGRLDDVFEGAAGVDRKADRAAGVYCDFPLAAVPGSRDALSACGE